MADPNEMPVIEEPSAPRGVPADERDPDFCGREGTVTSPRGAAQAAHPMFGAPKVYFVTFGCQMNKNDTEMMMGALEAHGYAFTEDEGEADVILYNTCSVRQHAEDRVLGRMGALKHRKKRDPGVAIGLVGCMAQRDGENLMRRMPHLDLVLGTQMLDELPGLLARVRSGGEKIVATESRPFAAFREAPARRARPFQAWLTVSRGCDKRCTFCVVPLTRGPEVSRAAADIAEEAKALVDDGVGEITLLGQTIDSYGQDRDDGASLAGLLETLAPLADRGLKRLRFVTSHPCHIDETLMRAMADLKDVVCPFLHMPAQSGSDRVLRRMKRLYTRDRYVERCDRAREIVPGLAIASDFIVGFCGETEEDFRASLSLLERCRFSTSYVFKYSVRPATPAAKLPDDVPDALKRERNQALLAAQQAVSESLNRALIGSVENVLVEGPSRTRPDLLSGRTRTNRIVIFAGEKDLIGRELPVEITDATALSLRGRLPAG